MYSEIKNVPKNVTNPKIHKYLISEKRKNLTPIYIARTKDKIEMIRKTRRVLNKFFFIFLFSPSSTGTFFIVLYSKDFTVLYSKYKIFKYQKRSIHKTITKTKSRLSNFNSLSTTFSVKNGILRGIRANNIP